MPNCKNCKYTDEYCASGDCTSQNDLTEQWKKGELLCRWYYIKIADIVFIDFFEGKVWKNKKDEYIEEVLAPVPSYEEWKEKLRALDAAYETIKMEDETINRLVRSGKQCNYENAQFKEQIERLEKRYDRAKWWLNEIVNNHRFTPISTAEKALKDLSELENA